MSRPDIVLVTVECARSSDADLLAPADASQHSTVIVPGHYTRPSLAGILSGQYRAAAAADLVGPTLPDVLGDAGYTTIGVCYSPQAAVYSLRPFDVSRFWDADNDRLRRGSKYRERLAEVGLVRRLYRYLQPKSATLEQVPDDDMAVDRALSAFDDADRPRFLWVHLMDSHRPYGRGEDALPASAGRKAAHTTTGVPDDLHRQVVGHYRQGLRRARERVAHLLGRLPDSVEWVVVGDHGEELGEHGYYFHSGYRRRLVDEVVKVPLWTSIDDELRQPLGGVDIAALLACCGGAEQPEVWDGNPRGSRVQSTFAPWGSRCSVRISTPTDSIVVEDGESSVSTRKVNREGVRDRLAALGYH